MNRQETSPARSEPAHPSAFGGQQLLAPGVTRLRLPLSNAFLLGEPGQPWVLLDAGTPGSAAMIVSAAESRFGSGAVPQAIVLTHGHLDHIGGLFSLRRRWPEVPIYAHPLELPYLTGRSAYPPPDPTVGGSMSRLSPLFVPGPFDFGRQVRPLDELPDLPALHGWELLHTPGHAPGHVSLWRPADRLLIAGDAFVTTVQESALSALTLTPRQVHRPPAYYTPDWDAARESVHRLRALGPALAISGHGDAVGGPELERGLRELADHFDQQARPNRGRYVAEPARTDLSGVTSLPPKPAGRHLTAWAVVALLALLVMRSRRKSGTSL